MAKKNDFMDGRNEGMLYAYNYAKEHGIDALEKEIEMRRITNLPTGVSKKAMQECITLIKHHTIDSLIVLMVATLRDELGFGAKRIKRIVDRFELKAKCLSDDYVTWQDIIDDIKSDLGIDLGIRKGL